VGTELSRRPQSEHPLHRHQGADLSQPRPYDAIILGAGGAGLMCAAVAGQRGRRVLLIDHADQPGKKILISGGGRCNFTNIHTAPDRYLSANPHFMKSALRRYTAQDFIDLVDRHRIAWHEKTLGQLFCDGSARQIVNMLMEECAKGAARISLGKRISEVSHGDGSFRLCYGGEIATAPALVIATGGPSIPKMGATGFAYDLARKFGLKVVEPRPALVPLTLGGEETLFRSLSGVATEVIARSRKTAFREAALFTHKGISGPAILQISSYWRHGQPIGIDFLPGRDAGWVVAAKRARPRTHFHTLVGELPPDRLAEALAKRIGLWGELANIPDRKLEEADGSSPTGISTRTAPKASPRPRSPPAGSAPTSSPRRRWRRRRCPASTRSARASTSPAGSAAIISNGPGRAAGPPAKPSDPLPLPRRTPHGLLMTFSELPPLLSEALAARGYETPTPVQAAVLEADAAGRDLIVSAQTGSGKTVAFGLAMAPQLLEENGNASFVREPLALIIAPTRELALQVSRELIWLYGKAGARIATCVGGMDAPRSVGTSPRARISSSALPGRLRDHLERGALDLRNLRVAILDEADEMLDMGFREDLEEILDATPNERRTMMFSATIPKPIVALAKRYQKDALRISTVGEDRGHGDISYQAMAVAPADIENAVVNLLRLHDAETAMLFCATRDNVRRLHASLIERGFDAVALSGEHSQNERNAALQALRDRRARVCVATDVAARGNRPSDPVARRHVELPRDAETLQHRSGRTGRAGKKGTAVLIVPYPRRKRVDMMLRGAKIAAEWVKCRRPRTFARTTGSDCSRRCSSPWRLMTRIASSPSACSPSVRRRRIAAALVQALARGCRLPKR
jgi:predicted Rossmann fold flavoprotein